MKNKDWLYGMKIIPEEDVIKRLMVTNDTLFLVVTSKKNRLFEKPIGADLINVGYLKNSISSEIEKAEERGYEKGVGNQAKLDRELYGMSFEEIKKKYPKEV